MRHSQFLTGLTVLYWLFCSIVCEGQPNRQAIDATSLPKPMGWVSDYYDLYTPVEEATLNTLIDSFERKTTIEIALVILREDMPGADSVVLDEFTLTLANAWGIGKKEYNNGILIGISPAHRRMRIQNGYGIEAFISNEMTMEIVKTGFLPGFIKGDYFEGTMNGLITLMKTLTDTMEKENIHFYHVNPTKSIEKNE